MSNDNNKKSKSLDNTINIYEQLRLKIGDTFNYWLSDLRDHLREAETGKKLVDRHRALFDAQNLVSDFKKSAYALARTYDKNHKLSEYDFKKIEEVYGKDVADYERARAGVWNDDNNQS